jgi:hypothetical protein
VRLPTLHPGCCIVLTGRQFCCKIYLREDPAVNPCEIIRPILRRFITFTSVSGGQFRSQRFPFLANLITMSTIYHITTTIKNAWNFLHQLLLHFPLFHWTRNLLERLPTPLTTITFYNVCPTLTTCSIDNKTIESPAVHPNGLWKRCRFAKSN